MRMVNIYVRLPAQQKNPFSVRSQFVTSSWGGSRYLPFAFTEQGVAMLSSVLGSEKAIEVNIGIMRAFVVIRQFLVDTEKTNKETQLYTLMYQV